MNIKTNSLSIITVLIFVLCTTYTPVDAQKKSGGFVLAFDDGYPSWIEVIAPELKKLGGVASGFVNNQRIQNGYITMKQLRELQDNFGWDIGTHTFHHLNAPDFIEQNGVSAWLSQEVDDSIAALAKAGIRVESMVFPFNALNDELSKAALTKVATFRREGALPLSNGLTTEGSYVATAIDLEHYVPMSQLKIWIDFAQRQNKLLMVYGHEVLPDEEFYTGTITKILGTDRVELDQPLPENHRTDLTLVVPNIKRRTLRSGIRIAEINGKEIRLLGPAYIVSQFKPGHSFLIGPAYSMQYSFFKELIEYAAQKLPFYTVSYCYKNILDKNKTK